MSEDIVWINVIPNPNKTADNQPDWVAPANPNAPEGKKWTIGVKIGETWHSQAGWNTKADNGELTGGITLKLTPNNPGAAKTGTENKGFTSKPTSSNNQEYKF